MTLKLKQRVLGQRSHRVNKLAAAEVEVAEVGGVERRPGFTLLAEARVTVYAPGGQSNAAIMMSQPSGAVTLTGYQRYFGREGIQLVPNFHVYFSIRRRLDSAPQQPKLQR